MYVQKLVTLLCLCYSIYLSEGKSVSINCVSSTQVILPKYGILKGSIAKTAWTNRIIHQFLGVKYGESPSGARRFQAPVPVKPWRGIRDARNFGTKCPVLEDLLKISKNERNEIDLEDCLNMAIYSPNLNACLPVMVYVHGGSFYLHSADEFPSSYFLERDVILVVVQYRLDALGFLSTNTADIPGNAALKDVMLALNFIKKNIAYFGGNPNKITLFGQSSGAAMVSALIISPAVPQNLFDQVIIQSGSVLSKWSYTTNPVTDARDIAQAAGLDPNQSLNLLNEAFIKMDVVDLLQAVERYQKNVTSVPLILGGRSFSIGGPTNLLPDLPEKILLKYNKTIPMIIGATKDDGSFVATALYDFFKAFSQEKDDVSFMKLVLGMVCSFFNAADNCTTVQSKISSTFWTADELASNDFAKMAPGLIKFLGTYLFKEHVYQLALANAKSNENNTFMYTFDYRGEKTRFGYGEDTSHYPFEGGVTHSDDLIYLFPYPLDIANLNDADKQFAQKLLDLWTTFATNGSPRVIGNTMEKQFLWPPIQSGTMGPYAHLNKKLTIDNDYTKELYGIVSSK